MVSRKSITLNNITDTFQETECNGFPDKFSILKAKAELLEGDGSEIAISVRQRSNPTLDEDTVLEYDLVTTLDDEITNGALVIPAKRRDTDIASIWIAAKSDMGTNNKVRVTLEYTI